MDAELTNEAPESIAARSERGRSRESEPGLGNRPHAVAILVLQEIGRAAETTPSAAAAPLQFGQATITNIVDRLTSSRLITRQRSHRDRRQVILRATRRQTIADAPDLLQKQFHDCFSLLAPWEQAMILAALERLGDILDAGAIDAGPLLDTGAIGWREPI